jgi:hypothetical protein
MDYLKNMMFKTMYIHIFHLIKKILNNPQNQKIKYMVFVGNLKNGTILDCKRLHSKMHSEYFCQMTVKGL